MSWMCQVHDIVNSGDVPSVPQLRHPACHITSLALGNPLGDVLEKNEKALHVVLTPPPVSVCMCVEIQTRNNNGLTPYVQLR